MKTWFYHVTLEIINKNCVWHQIISFYSALKFGKYLVALWDWQTCLYAYLKCRSDKITISFFIYKEEIILCKWFTSIDVPNTYNYDYILYHVSFWFLNIKKNLWYRLVENSFHLFKRKCFKSQSECCSLREGFYLAVGNNIKKLMVIWRQWNCKYSWSISYYQC